jgi:hypothetical protein
MGASRFLLKAQRGNTMPFGKSSAGDFESNPHFLSGGVVTALPQKYKYDASDCTGSQVSGGDQYLGHTGLFIHARILHPGQFHRFQVRAATDPKRAAFNFTSEDSTLIGCIWPPFYPERAFNQGNVDRLFVFAGSFGNKPACFNPSTYRPIRGCPTAYGWLIEVDSGGTGNYDMTILFLQGP